MNSSNRLWLWPRRYTHIDHLSWYLDFWEIRNMPQSISSHRFSVSSSVIEARFLGLADREFWNHITPGKWMHITPGLKPCFRDREHLQFRRLVGGSRRGCHGYHERKRPDSDIFSYWIYLSIELFDTLAFRNVVSLVGQSHKNLSYIFISLPHSSVLWILFICCFNYVRNDPWQNQNNILQCYLIFQFHSFLSWVFIL